MAIDYVRRDEHGVLRVANTHVMLDSVVAAFHQGHSAETIRSQYPNLSLEQVYGAITYYLGHQEEVDEYLRHQGHVWQEGRCQSETENAALLHRLREVRRSEAAKQQ